MLYVSGLNSHSAHLPRGPSGIHFRGFAHARNRAYWKPICIDRGVPRTRTYTHPPRPLDVALSSADRVWIHPPEPLPSLVTRVASEFREMPGLALTVDQAARLFHLGAEDCWQILEQLH